MHKLPELPYKIDALEPHVDKETMEIHHGKHHAGYVANLNSLLEGKSDLNNLSLEELLKKGGQKGGLDQAIVNNAGGHANHSFFWKIMSPKKSNPSGKLLDAIESKAGNLKSFKEHFSQKAMTLFGSGWVFLIIDKKGNISIKRRSFQNSPLMDGNIPVLGLDVWEHAYYLKYKNRRADYIKAWWNVVNWVEVEKLFSKHA